MVGSKRFSPYLNVLVPSGLGLVAYGVIAAIILFVENLAAVQRYFYAPEELQLQHNLMQKVGSKITGVLGLSHSSTLALYLFWVLVGLVVYAVLALIVTNARELEKDLQARHNIWPQASSKDRPLLVFLAQVLFRAVIFVLTLLYVQHVLAFALGGPLDSFWPANQWLHMHAFTKGALLVLVDIALLHGLVVLLRLLLLRSRLFSSA